MVTGSTPLFLIIDGYPKENRDEFDVAGMKHSWLLYAEMLQRHLPEAQHKVWLASDTPELPDGLGPADYTGILWTGCSLTIYHHHDDRVTRMIELAKRAYEVGTPSFGTCWGVQMAALVAGGEVKANPKGREMGLGRKIRLTAAGKEHLFMAGKPEVYSGFVSHDDEVTALPPGATLLATNDFSEVQALAVTYRKGTFWALQYHPEYNLHEMARLIVTREQKLIKKGFFNGPEDLHQHVERLEALYADPARKDLRWQLDVDDDVLSDDVRQVEFANWIQQQVLPRL